MINVFPVVFTKCKYALDERFGEDKVTVGSSKANIPETFPAALIVQLGSPATSISFTNTQHAVISTIEVHTYSQDAEESLNIMNRIGDTLNEINYALIFGAEDISTDVDITHYVARFRRTIGAGDTIKIF